MRSTPRTPPSVSLATSFAAASVLFLAGAAFGQHALGDGSALDRNLQVGSGGRNTVVRDLQSQIRFNNAVVTGNAGYGKSFHGYVGYTAPNEFRASLGTNDLYPFLRDTAQQPFVSTGASSAASSQRYQFAVSTGQAPPSGLTGPGAYVPRSGFASSAGLITNTRTTSDYLTRQSIEPALVGYGKTTDGKAFTQTASPLMGINASLVPQPPSTIQPVPPTGPAIKPVDTPNPFAPGPVPSKPATGTPTPISPGANVPKVPDLAGTAAATAKPFNTQIETRLQTPTIVAEQLQRELARAKAENPDKAGSPGAPPETSESRQPWDAQMDRIRRALSTDADRKPRPSPAEPAAPADQKQPARPGDRGTPGSNEPGKDKVQDKGPESLSDRVKRLSDPSLAKLDPDAIKAMQRTRPLIPSFSSDARVSDKAYNDHMAAGQRLFGEGRFFDAEERFARALDAAPHDPLAQIGETHSQLSAGLYLSAGLNLRTLFRSHPEMVGARYAKSISPPDDRVAVILPHLREALTDERTGMGREAALLIAYLGYQRSDKKLLDEGLAALAARTDPDSAPQATLLGLLHRVWVEGKDPAPEPPTRPAPGAPPEKNPGPSK